MYISFPSGSQPAINNSNTSTAPEPGSDINSQSLDALTPNLHVNLEVLAADISDIEHSVHHLTRSNNELRQALEEDPDEKEYQKAIYENMYV